MERGGMSCWLLPQVQQRKHPGNNGPDSAPLFRYGSNDTDAANSDEANGFIRG